MTVSPARYPEVRQKWRSWLDDIEAHVLDLHHNRDLWTAMKDALLTTDAANSDVFLQHYTKMYVDGAAMAVRRLASASEFDKDSISIGRLLSDLKRMPEAMDAAAYVALHGHDDDSEEERQVWRRRAAEAYETKWGDGSGHLSLDRLDQDLQSLSDQSASVAAFADRTIAHIDKRKMASVPTFDDLNGAIDEIGAMFKRYALLLTASSWLGLVPTVQGDWRAPFRQPLFEPFKTRPPRQPE